MNRNSPKAGKRLVIVESPAKARTIQRYLGQGYDVVASVGHIRDLPPKELGVDVDNGFEPKYVTIRGKGKVITDLKRKAKGVVEVLLATDPDREGEAIAYHVAEQLGDPTDTDYFRRVQFHEITRDTVRRSLESAGTLDMKKVEAQQARRILDRLVGYQVSPFLWKPIFPGLSAGRVQTVALRVIWEREEEIRAFRSQEYWSVTAHLSKDGQDFDAKLHHTEGKAVHLGNESQASAVLADIQDADFPVTEVKRRERRKNPTAPFTTSTLQQEAAKRIRFSARRTMTTAQRLYEGVELGARGAVGLITYMRTDSTRVAGVAVEQARTWIAEEMGKQFVAKAPRYWAEKKQKGAQEAHEAIRPTDVTIHPTEVYQHLADDQARLYELVWLRFVASQMEPAVYDTTTADFDVQGTNSTRVHRFRATGSVVKFEGFTRLYLEAAESGDHRRLDDLEPLPVLDVDDRFSWNGGAGSVGVVGQVEPKQHFTQPPPRYSEASLVRALEEQGIGRPSTYAQIISTIQDRSYVEIEDRRFHPTGLGEVVVKLLVKVFPDIFEVAFTSQMEGQLDQVEEGEVDWQQLLGRFYPRLRELLAAGEGRSDKIVREILAAEGDTCDLCGRPMQVRFNKFGSFLGCSGYPDCKGTRSLDQGRAEENHLGVDPANGQPVFLKEGPYGPYVERSAADEGQKPSRTSLPAGRKPADVDLAYALRLLSLPRSLGLDPSSSEEVLAGLGRYGPYVRRGKTFANLRSENELFGVGLEEALTRLAQKQSGKSVLRELGPHPESGNDVQVLSGRYGPYVSDGEVNATIPKTWDPLEVGMEEAAGLLRERAAKGGGKGRRRQRVAVGGAQKAAKKGAKKGARKAAKKTTPENDA
ncbi:MAG TPA: type I DNA topoisomerase [Gemmatimonadetes bacterium]|nr:type I DNA topoisomerase [Gemmatimonadota bacterium]|tara:strand:+ start:11500 stop:14109 length:2610 start_codon:yes stop_codon:yes gene_type:complete